MSGFGRGKFGKGPYGESEEMRRAREVGAKLLHDITATATAIEAGAEVNVDATDMIRLFEHAMKLFGGEGAVAAGHRVLDAESLDTTEGVRPSHAFLTGYRRGAVDMVRAYWRAANIAFRAAEVRAGQPAHRSGHQQRLHTLILDVFDETPDVMTSAARAKATAERLEELGVTVSTDTILRRLNRRG